MTFKWRIFRRSWPSAYLHFDLYNCGVNFPEVSGTAQIVKQSFDLRSTGLDGSISGIVYGNDTILCGNVASTQWIVTPMLFLRM